MEDDIDDLLDAAESTFTKPAKQSQAKSTSHIASSPVKTEKKDSQRGAKSKKKDELNSMIDDIFDDCNIDVETTRLGRTLSVGSNSTASARTASPNVGNRKCFPIYMGGTDVQQGVATAVNKRCCDKLRCTECDFSVSSFENFKWDGSTDYLFLRNNMPDYHRLKEKLIPCRGFRAYACQCKWKTVKDITDMQKETELRWFCGRH